MHCVLYFIYDHLEHGVHCVLWNIFCIDCWVIWMRNINLLKVSLNSEDTLLQLTQANKYTCKCLIICSMRFVYCIFCLVLVNYRAFCLPCFLIIVGFVYRLTCLPCNLLTMYNELLNAPVCSVFLSAFHIVLGKHINVFPTSILF